MKSLNLGLAGFAFWYMTGNISCKVKVRRGGGIQNWKMWDNKRNKGGFTWPRQGALCSLATLWQYSETIVWPNLWTFWATRVCNTFPRGGEHKQELLLFFIRYFTYFSWRWKPQKYYSGRVALLLRSVFRQLYNFQSFSAFSSSYHLIAFSCIYLNFYYAFLPIFGVFTSFSPRLIIWSIRWFGLEGSRNLR